MNYPIRFLISGLLFGFLVCGNLQAQRIKYKEVFPLLYPQPTEEGINLLRQFLKDEKNQEEANANYQLGEYFYQEYLAKDVLNDTVTLFEYGDSAKWYFARSVEFIDEKELKKNDEYYQDFYRRDLRTGEFGIKLSDVHLDIEKKIENIESRNKQVIILHETLQSMKSTHQSLVSAFNRIISKFNSYESYLMQLDNDQRDALNTLIDFQYQLKEKSKSVNEIFGRIDATNLLGDLYEESVNTYGKLDDIFDPYENQFKSWDVEQWVDQTNELFKSEIVVYRSALMNWDQSLNLVEDRLADGSASNIQLDGSDQMEVIKNKFDPKSAMKDYLKIKAQYLTVKMLTDTVVTPQWLDTMQVAANAALTDSLILLAELTTSQMQGTEDNIRESASYYKDHIEKLYGGISAISQNLTNWERYLNQVRTEWKPHQVYWNDKNTWVTWEDQMIAIDTTINQDTLNLQSFSVRALNQNLSILGLDVSDSSVFVMGVSPDRQVDWLTQTDINYYENSDYQWMEAPTGQTVFYSFHPLDSLGELNLAKINQEGDLLWNVQLIDASAPHHISWDGLIDQYTIYFYPEDSYPLTDGTEGFILINGNGEIK